MDTISDKCVKAIKDHKCNFCDGIIRKGETYHAMVLKCDGTIYQWKSHFRCDKVVSKLDMFDRCDEGVTQDDFYEYVNEEYYKILGENEPTTKSFPERLDIVCNHFKITE